MKFTVVIVTKDRLMFLERCLDSITKSTLIPEQVVIVNDSITPVDFKGVKFTFDLVIINNGSSFGANYCRNIGVNHALNEVVFMLDDDDSVTTDSFMNRIRLFKANHDVGLVYTGANVVLSNDLSTVIKTISTKERGNYHCSLLSNGNVIGSTSRVGFTKKAFYKAGGFDEQLKCRQDYDLWIRMSKITSIANDPNIGINYTIHTNHKKQTSHGYKKFLIASLYLYDKYNDAIKEKKLSKKFKANSYFRVAQIASKESDRIRIKYAFISFIQAPTAKSLILILLPNYIINKYKLFT